jgi:hypothetical protein
MKAEYDFSKAKKNPYAKRLKRRVTIRLDGPTVDYFKQLAEETGIPYQTLINLYLRDCAESKRELTFCVQRPPTVNTGPPTRAAGGGPRSNRPRPGGRWKADVVGRRNEE